MAPRKARCCNPENIRLHIDRALIGVFMNARRLHGVETKARSIRTAQGRSAAPSKGAQSAIPRILGHVGQGTIWQ